MPIRLRIFVLLGAALGAALACGPDTEAVAGAPGCAQAPATLFEGGTILTMDSQHPLAPALLVREGRVIETSPGGVAAAAVPDACLRTVDLEGATLMPGFIDGHAHVRELGMDALKVDLVGASDVDEIVRRLQAAHPQPPEDEWIIGQGWDEGAFASGGYPDRAALDEAFPDVPVALESLHGFAGFYNDAALRVAGVSADTPDPEGGTILRRPDGEPTGIMLALAQGIVASHVPAPTVAQREAAIVAGLELMASEGVTSVHEAGMSAEDVQAFQRLADAERLPIRVYGMLTGNDEALMQRWFERGPLEHDSGRLTIRSIKVFYDGSLGSRTAVLSEPYHDAPDLAAPAERITPERMASLATRAANHGFQMAVHAIGDEGNRRTLKVFADALAPHRDLDHRWRIEHAQVVGPDFFEVAPKLGVIVSMQPSHAVGDSAWAEERLGPERVTRAYAWRSMLEAGIRLILNSDLPGEPWTPAQTLYFAVTRQRLDGPPGSGWRPEQALTVEETLHGMTAESAHAAFQEQELGRLVPGMRADLVVVDRNPLEVEPAALKDLRVLQTWVEGEPVWIRDEAR